MSTAVAIDSRPRDITVRRGQPDVSLTINYDTPRLDNFIGLVQIPPVICMVQSPPFSGPTAINLIFYDGYRLRLISEGVGEPLVTVPSPVTLPHVFTQINRSRSEDTSLDYFQVKIILPTDNPIIRAGALYYGFIFDRSEIGNPTVRLHVLTAATNFAGGFNQEFLTRLELDLVSIPVL